MFELKNRKDSFRLILPKDFLAKELDEKYTKIITRYNGFYKTPIDFLNETIQKVDVLGFNNAVINQQQQVQPQGQLISDGVHSDMSYPSYDNIYRNPQSYLSLTDLTMNIEFKHTLGYINYFMIYENFMYQYSRERTYDELPQYFKIEIFNELGEVLCNILFEKPLINGIDMLSLDYTQPIAQSETFKVEVKYSNLKFNFLKTFEDESTKTS